MNTLNRLLLACVLLMSFAIAGFAEELTIPGSGNPEYVLGRTGEGLQRPAEQTPRGVPSSSGTAGALREVEEGTATIGRVGRPLKPAERDEGSVRPPGPRRGGIRRWRGGNDQDVTREQMVAAYIGKVTDWRELGGKPGPIRAIGREPTDASRQVIDRAILASQTSSSPKGSRPYTWIRISSNCWIATPPAWDSSTAPGPPGGQEQAGHPFA